MKQNPFIAELKTGYLFPEIHKRKIDFLKKHPHAKVISLGIGDTTEPLTTHICQGLVEKAKSLSSLEGYSGYGPAQGEQPLRRAIAKKLYHHLIEDDEVFISDGAKSDIGRLLALFGPSPSIAIQEPAYPAYIDASIIYGHKQHIHFMPCTQENHFFPTLDKKTDLIFFCSPNNPTGAVATYDQLQKLVAFATKNRSIIIYDVAYRNFIKDKSLPKTIYEIEGAKKVAIEIGSFSKMAGFTGVRVGWSIVPKDLLFDNGTSVYQDWMRVVNTLFNGASNIAQAGAMHILDNQGLQEVEKLTDFYLENAQILKETLQSLKFEVFGGDNTPYLWVKIPGKTSWEAFDYLLQKTHIVTTPGVGFGKTGEGFIRFSSFGHRKDIIEASKRLRKALIKTQPTSEH